MLIIGLLVLIWVVFKDWRLPYWLVRDEKKSNIEELAHRQQMKRHLRKHPYDDISRKYYPDLVEQNKALDDYMKIENDYTLGRIDSIDFQVKAMPLLEKIDINDLY